MERRQATASPTSHINIERISDAPFGVAGNKLTAETGRRGEIVLWWAKIFWWFRRQSRRD